MSAINKLLKMKLDLVHSIKWDKIDWTLAGVLQALFYGVAGLIVNSFDYIQVKDNILWAMAIAIVLDTVTGVSKSIKLGIKPTSRDGWRGLYGKFLGILFLAGGTAILKLLGINITVFLNTCLTILTVYEVYSAGGNVYTWRTGKKVEEYDAMSIVLKVFLEKLKEIAEILIKKNKPN